MKKTKLNDLAELTSEEWTFSREGATKNGILVNYLAHTYERLEYENKIFVYEKMGERFEVTSQRWTKEYNLGGSPQMQLTEQRFLSKYYQGYTCLTLDMAYNNARLIARLNSI